MIIADLWQRYDVEHIERRTVDYATPRYSWQNLSHYFGPCSLAEISQISVDGYERLRVNGVIGRPSKPSTVRRELLALRACLNWCADPRRKIINAADIPLFDLPKEAAPRDRWLTTDEIQRLIIAARSNAPHLSRVERFLWLALETAGRKTALCELTWDRVDLETNVIHLAASDTAITKKRRASVPISKALLPILLRAKSEATTNHVLDNDCDIWSALSNVAAAAKVKGVSPHVLRHTAATHMARRGVPLWKIAKVLGNSLTMVEKVYAKHCPDDLREAVDMISAGSLVAG